MSREEVSRAIGAIVDELGYECVNVAWTMESARPVIRVYIDSLGGINIADCEVVSKAVNRYLDSEDAPELSDRYYLEVSSPGLERPLFSPADYERFRGREARVKTFEPLEGRKLHTGILEDSDEATVILATPEGRVRISFEAIARATLVFRGLEPQEPKKTKKNGNKAEPKKSGKKHEEEH